MPPFYTSLSPSFYLPLPPQLLCPFSRLFLPSTHLFFCLYPSTLFFPFSFLLSLLSSSTLCTISALCWLMAASHHTFEAALIFCFVFLGDFTEQLASKYSCFYLSSPLLLFHHVCIENALFYLVLFATLDRVHMNIQSRSRCVSWYCTDTKLIFVVNLTSLLKKLFFTSQFSNSCNNYNAWTYFINPFPKVTLACIEKFMVVSPCLQWFNMSHGNHCAAIYDIITVRRKQMTVDILALTIYFNMDVNLICNINQRRCFGFIDYIQAEAPNPIMVWIKWMNWPQIHIRLQEKQKGFTK